MVEKKMTLGQKMTYGTLALVLTSPAFAEGGFGDAAATAVEGSKADLTTVGVAVIAVAALIFGIRTVKRLIGG